MRGVDFGRAGWGWERKEVVGELCSAGAPDIAILEKKMCG